VANDSSISRGRREAEAADAVGPRAARRIESAARAPTRIGVRRCTGSGSTGRGGAVDQDLARPGAPHQRHLLRHAPLAASIERRSERGVVVGPRADADAEVDAAARQHVERGDLLGERAGASVGR
jgi:hypothetical protein